MACRGCLECLLKLLNFLLMVTGLAMVGYGIYLLVEWKKMAPGGDDPEFLKLGRPMLLALSLSDSILDKLPKAWWRRILDEMNFWWKALHSLKLYQNEWLEIDIELGAAAFIFFDHSWREVIPVDKTGDFDMIYNFLKENWKIAKWVALGAVIFEALVFVLALIVRAANKPFNYDSDDEYIAPRSSVRQPLINRQGVPATGVPVLGTLDQRPSRNDAWSQRMREKYGLDTSEFTYNPSDPNRYQAAAPPAEERGCCTIL